MKCKECTHWKRIRDTIAGNCSCGKFVYDDGGSYPECNGQNLAVDGLKYYDFEGYAAGLETGEDFGCVHFAPRVI